MSKELSVGDAVVVVVVVVVVLVFEVVMLVLVLISIVVVEPSWIAMLGSLRYSAGKCFVPSKSMREREIKWTLYCQNLYFEPSIESHEWSVLTDEHFN